MQNLAWHEMRLQLATVVRAFDKEIAGGSWGWANQKVFSLWDKKPLCSSLTPVD
jgi:hypothetical protein